MSVVSLKPAAKTEVKNALIKFFNDIGFNISDLDQSEGQAEKTKLENACDALAVTIVDSVLKPIISSKSTITTFGSATTQTSQPNPGVGQGLIIGE